MHTATAVPSPSSKFEIRAEALARRRAFARSLDATLRGLLEVQLAANVLPHIPSGAHVAAYAPMRDEIDPGPILAALEAAGHVTALPWFAGRDAAMMFRATPPDHPGPWGVMQPASDAAVVRPTLVLVPLVAADLDCNRIGHGKGHYDRALSNLRGAGGVRTIGLAWDIQLSDRTLPADPWDVPLDAIATPDRWTGKSWT